MFSGSADGYRRRVLSRLTVALVGGAVALLVACGGSDVETTDDPGEIAFDLESETPREARGIRATLTFESRDATKIVVDGLDESEPAGGGANPVSLRSGTCDDRKETLFELESLRGNVSESTVELGLPALLNGDYFLAVALAPDQPEIIACGDIPDEAPETEGE
jgi:hypothetical protein